MPAAVASPLLDLIRSQGILDDLQLEAVTEEHNRNGKPIPEILADFDYLDIESQLQIIANHLGTEVIQLGDRDFTPEVLHSVPSDTARMYRCMPVAVFDSSIQVALADPLNPAQVDELAYVLGKEIVPLVAD